MKSEIPSTSLATTGFSEASCGAIDKLPDVLERKGAGKPKFDSRSRIVAVLVKAWLGKSYQDVEAYLYDNKETLATFNLVVPDYNTLMENPDVFSRKTVFLQFEKFEKNNPWYE